MKKWILILIVLVNFLVGCSNDKNETVKSLRVGFFPNITHAQALIGKAEGTYEKSIGIPIDWKQFNAGPSEIEAIFAGELDLGFIGPGPAINGYAKSNGEVQIIAGVANAGAILVASKQSGITDGASLSGKRIAIPQFGNTQDLCLRMLLENNGLKDTTKGGTVEIFQVSNADVQGLLERGEIDGALVPEPWGSLIEANIDSVLVLDSDEIWRDGNYPSCVVIARKEFVEENPVLIDAFLSAHIELTNLLNENIEDAGSIINNELLNLTKKQIDNQVLKSALRRIAFTQEPQKEAIIEMAKFSYDTGYLKEMPDMTNIFNLERLELQKQ